MRSCTQPRRGAALLEFALVAPWLFLLLLGTIVGSAAVSDYQRVSLLAREASRYACVRGTQYAADQAAMGNTQNTAATAATINTNAIVPMASGLNLSNLSTTITWTNNNPSPAAATWMATVTGSGTVTSTGTNTCNNTFYAATVTGGTVTVANTVTVTVSYQWGALAYFGAGTFSSSSTSIMYY